MAVNMESWTFKPPDGLRACGPHGSRLARLGEEGPSSLNSSPSAVGRAQTPSGSSTSAFGRTQTPSGRGSTRTFSKIQRAPVQYSPPDTASTRIFHQIQGAAVHQLTRIGSTNTLDQNPGPPVQDLPTGTGAPDSSDQLEEFRWQIPWIFSWNMTRVTNFLSPLRKRLALLPISGFLASLCLRSLTWLQICD